MNRRILPALLLTGLLVAAFLSRGPVGVVLGQDPTIPTRTPTPGPVVPTATNPASEPTATTEDEGNPPPPPASPSATTASPGTATATLDPAATATATPPGGSLPTATATATGTIVASRGGDTALGFGCDDTPYVRALDRTLVFVGPGEDYAAIAELFKDDIRPIIGRGEFAPWWQIQVSETLIGWVADEDVDEFGNTGRVPLASPPEINGATPTPGLPWNPTPLPFACTVTPTPTPTPSQTPTTTPTATAVGLAETAAAATVDAVLQSGESAGGTGASASLPGSAGDIDGKQLPASGDGPSPSSYILPLAGVGLVAAGIIVALLARSQGSAGATRKPGE